MTEALGSRPAPGTPSAKRSVGTRRAASMQEPLSEGTARTAQLAPSAVTAGAVGGPATRGVVGRVSRLSGGRMSAFLLAAAEAATALVTSQWEPAPFPLRRLRLPTSGASQIPLGNPTRSFRPASGTFKSRLEKRVGARGERLVVGRVAARAAMRPSPSPTRRREWEARHYRARATSCGVPSYLSQLLPPRSPPSPLTDSP